MKTWMRHLALGVLTTLLLSNVAAAHILKPLPPKRATVSPTVNLPQAYSSWYGVFSLGFQFTKEQSLAGLSTRPVLTFEPGYHFGGAVGYQFTKHLRSELQYTYLRQHNDKLANANVGGRTTASFVLANTYWDFAQLHNGATGYVGAGVGFARLKVGAITLPDSDQYKLAYQGTAGVKYNLDNMFYFDASYRYIGTPRPEVLFCKRFHSHAVTFGIGYNVPAY